MAYIVREDGERFVIPSYRDTLVVKQKSALKNEILLLSQNYGEYITLQEKGANQYEVAFSTETGYLLGESIWHYFKRPLDLIYCEEIPNTTEALLVIVKSGNVYLDGKFPIESIPEELVIFLTQQNNFEINIHGNVPISQVPEEGKFSFEESSVKSFNVLDKPIFQTLPLYKMYQLQLVETVLKAHRIGVLPIRQVLMLIIALVLGYMLYSYLTKEQPLIPTAAPEANPYQGYFTALTSPAPDVEIRELLRRYRLLITIIGWAPTNITYSKGTMNTMMKSSGGSMDDLLNWAKLNNRLVTINKSGIFVGSDIKVENRKIPKEIFTIKNVIATFIDRLSTVYPGNNFTVGDFADKGVYKEVFITLNLNDVSPVAFSLIGDQLTGLPMSIQSMTLTVTDGNFGGTIILQALGN